MLSTNERRALRHVASEEGRTWKSRLRSMWELAQYPGYEHEAGTLQALRNASHFGPRGLDRCRPEDYQ